jgi:hypothetical protein
MRSVLTVVAVVTFVGLPVVAQEKATEGRKDPFDLSATAKQVKDLGVPTVSEVAALESKANDLYAAGEWKEAAVALDQFARKANWLANLIVAGLEPYYGASYDDRKNIGYANLQPLIPIEAKANAYKEKRNHAMVMRAECLAKLGDNAQAVSVLVGALDLIDINDKTWWERGRKQLYTLIELE